MSKSQVIFSFLTMGEVKSIARKIRRGRLEEEDLAVEIGDLLEDEEETIVAALKGNLGRDIFGNPIDQVYHVIRYCDKIYDEFETFHQTVKDMNSQEYRAYRRHLCKQQ